MEPSTSRSPMEQSFSIAAGEYTEEERKYLLQKGLIYENSKDETLDISTDVESINSSSLNVSHSGSLLIFEENERLYAEFLNKSVNAEDENLVDKSPIKSQESPALLQLSSSGTPERPLVNVSRLIEMTPLSPYRPNAEEDDKENVFKGPITGRVLLFQDEEIGKRDPLEEIKGIADESQMVDVDISSEKSFDERSSQASEDDNCIVPCTQEVPLFMEDTAHDTESDHVEVVPATQAMNESVNMNQTYTSVTLEESLAEVELENMEPCAVVLHESLAEEEIKDASSGMIVLEESLAELEVENMEPCAEVLDESLAKEEIKDASSDMVPLEESLAEPRPESEVLAPCTQAMLEESVISNISHLDISSIPCSQASQVSSAADASSKDEFNDTIALMEKLLAMADEQEEKEKQEAENEESSAALSCVAEESESKVNESSEPSQSQPETEIAEVYFKTPLKHSRVQLLKNKKVASPSPPRSFANNLLQQRGKKPVLPPTNNERKTPIVKKGTTSKPATTSGSPMSTSTPKRTPLTNITPAAKKTHTPGRLGIPKTPISAKVDTGLRSGGFPVGLSPVAKYIYDKPAPSKFARVQGVPNSKATTTSTVNTSLSTKIPMPPPRVSQVSEKQKTPASASKQPRHSVLRTSTYFNLTGTPPQVQIVANEKTLGEKKRFQPLQYTGAAKVKTLGGNTNSPRTDNYIAHRHTGLRDESGNASIIQDTSIHKRNIPHHHQSRLTTPKSYIRDSDSEMMDKENKSLPTTPRRERTFVISQ